MNDELQRRTSELSTMTQSFDDLMRSADVGLFALGTDRRIKHSNKLGQDMVGMAKGWSEAFDGARLHWDLKDVRAILDKVEAEEKPVHVERIAARKDRLVDVTFAPLRDHKDELSGYLITLVDQTQAHRTLAAADQGHRELRAAFDACVEPHIAFDASLSIVHANESARAAFGFKVDPIELTLEDLVKRRAGVLESSLELSSIAKVRTAVSKGEAYREEVRLDGAKKRAYEAVISPCEDDGRVRSVLVLRELKPS